MEKRESFSHCVEEVLCAREDECGRRKNSLRAGEVPSTRETFFRERTEEERENEGDERARRAVQCERMSCDNQSSRQMKKMRKR